jgi:hypothetical protein
MSLEARLPWPSARGEDRLGPVREVESSLRELVRKDAAQVGKPEPDLDMSDLSSFIQRVSAVSVIEIEKLIAELETLRAAERGSARPAGDCGKCAHESGGDQGHEDHGREPRAVEAYGRNRPPYPRMRPTSRAFLESTDCPGFLGLSMLLQRFPRQLRSARPNCFTLLGTPIVWPCCGRRRSADWSFARTIPSKELRKSRSTRIAS